MNNKMKILMIIVIMMIIVIGISIPTYIRTFNIKEIPIKAIIKTNSSIVYVNETISFIGDKSTGNIIKYFWDFGDGTNSTDKNPPHSFNTAGHYCVTLTIECEKNQKGKTNIDIGVQHQNMSLNTYDQRRVHTGGGRIGPVYSVEIGPNINNPTVDVSVLIVNGIGEFQIDLAVNTEIDYPTAQIVKIDRVSLYHQNYPFIFSVNSTDIFSKYCDLNALFLVFITIRNGEWENVITSVYANFSLEMILSQ